MGEMLRISPKSLPNLSHHHSHCFHKATVPLVYININISCFAFGFNYLYTGYLITSEMCGLTGEIWERKGRDEGRDKSLETLLYKGLSLKIWER